MNDAIDPGLCSLSCNTVDHVASVALALGTGALIAKIDVQAAHTQDSPSAPRI